MITNKTEKDILLTENIKPLVTSADIKNFLFGHYGLEVTDIKELNGYDDKNFLIKVKNSIQNEHIDAACDNGYVFKVINSLDSKDISFFEAQDSVLVHLADRNVCCPVPIKNKNGNYLDVIKLSSGIHIVRLLEFIPGTILANSEITPLLCYESGSLVATLHDHLKNFLNEGFKGRNTPWMLRNVPNLRDFLFAVKDDERRKLVNDIIESFKTKVLPNSENFQKGLIHGDVNEQNILVEQRNVKWHVKGILDFGDSHEGCLLYDVAITMTYLIIESKNIDYGGFVLAGYNSVRPLEDEGIDLLKICVCARICQSLVMGAFTISRDPSNTYVARTAKEGWSILENLWKTPDAEILRRWLEISSDFEKDEMN